MRVRSHDGPATCLTSRSRGSTTPCVWIPPEPGELTVTARITYDVVFTVSGFADVLAPYVWSSNPLTVRVDELSVVNTRTGN